MQRLILFLLTVISIQAMAQVKTLETAIATKDTLAIKQLFTSQKFAVKVAPAPKPVQTATWTIDTVLIAGSKSCIHQFRTIEGGENQKYAGTPDSLRTILNPNNERVVQEKCILCGREIIKSETLTWK